jgi:hypothetical protein
VQQAIRRALPTLSSRLKVKKLMRQEELVRNILHTRRLGADLASPQKKGRGARLAKINQSSRQDSGAGFRARGGGRKNKFLKFWQQVKTWHTCERLTGVQVDAQDIWLKFSDAATLEIKLLKMWHSKGKLPADQQVWLKELQERMQKLESNQKYQEVYLDRMMAWGGMKVGRPSRTSSMTLAEEHLNWKVSMKSWDRAVWLAGLGTAEDLEGVIALPAEFINRRADIALVMADQVPKFHLIFKVFQCCFLMLVSWISI